MKETLAIIASLLAVIGNVSYLTDTYKGNIKPHPYTWLVWTIVSLVTFFGQLAKGAGIGALPTGIAEGFTVLIFLYALVQFFRGQREHIHTSDTYFLIAALLGLIPWYITKDPTISVIVVVSIDLIAFIPTLRKTYHHPDTERPTLYEMNVARHLLALCALRAYNVATTLHSIVMIITNTLMTLFIFRKRE